MKEELSYDIIKAACNGDNNAREKIIEYYSDYIDALSDGDEDIRQALIVNLLETISDFDCENPENNERLLQKSEEN